MRLKDLEIYDRITIQAHDNPDADALASGFALYTYFKCKGKKVSFIYSGRYQIQKTDLRLMVERLQIPIEYRYPDNAKIEGLLITVDCQHGAGNVYCFQADNVVVIDHHLQEIAANNLTAYEIDSNLGSCSTLVWRMLMDEEYPVNDNVQVGTALYYGLFRDTNQFTELYYPLDRDMRELVSFDKGILHLLRNSTLSLKELELAGIALIRHIYNHDFHYAIIQTHPCDPNLLGLISDFLIQVDEIYTCVVFNYIEEGYKFSVRSCVREVSASELAQYLAKDIGSGGGHIERAGGFIKGARYEKYYPMLHAEAYFGNKLNEYFKSFDIIDVQSCDLNLDEMKRYERIQEVVGFVKLCTLLDIGTQCVIRTLEQDLELLIDEHSYILIDSSCRGMLITEEYFSENYKVLLGECNLNLEYTPKLKSKDTNGFMDLVQYMQPCINKHAKYVFAKKLLRGIKVFTPKAESYVLGKPGDYLVVSCEDAHDVSVVERSKFQQYYQ